MPSHDIHVRSIAGAAAAIALTVVAAVVAVLWLLSHWNASPSGDRAPPDARIDVPGPQLQSAPQVDLSQYRAEKQRQLDSTGWVDRSHGVAHIPIAEAMRMLVAPGRRNAAPTAEAGAAQPSQRPDGSEAPR